jgi:hypothetical protein
VVGSFAVAIPSGLFGLKAASLREKRNRDGTPEGVPFQSLLITNQDGTLGAPF